MKRICEKQRGFLEFLAYHFKKENSGVYYLSDSYKKFIEIILVNGEYDENDGYFRHNLEVLRQNEHYMKSYLQFIKNKKYLKK